MKLKSLACFSLNTLFTLFSVTAYAQGLGPRTLSTGSASPPRGALAVTPSGNWPQSRFDPAQTGYNPDESILSRDSIANLVLDWQYTSSDDPEGYSSAVVANNKVFFSGEIPPGFSVIHTFTEESGSADAGVTLRNGVLYGVTTYNATGSIAFQMAPWGDGWTYQPIATLPSGFGANSRLVFGPDGNPYGTMQYNNNEDRRYGFVYNLIPESLNGAAAKWHQNVLYQFQGAPDGAYPSSGDLLWDRQGHIFGATSSGGASNRGTIYELTCSGKICSEQVLYSFTGGTDGSNPPSGVVFDTAGNLYGTTIAGGLYGYGTVFALKYSNGSWTESVLYNFTGGNDGANPVGGVIFDSAGDLYGTTVGGGSGKEGTLFELSPTGDTWTFNLLYSFPFEIYTGCGPVASLVMDAAGSLYGNVTGCLYFAGNLFKLTKTGDSWDYTSLHAFGEGEGGVYPNGTLAIDANGMIYGTTSAGMERIGGPGTVWIFK